MGGVLALRRDCSVVSVAYDDPSTTREETTGLAQLAATIGASRNYPTLQTLAPARPSDAESCPHCPSFAAASLERDGCPMCWYLGWVSPKAPSWFLKPFIGTHANREMPRASPWWRRILRRAP